MMRAYIAIIGTLLVTGCDSQTSHVIEPAKQEALPGVVFSVDPGTVRVCDSDTAAKVSWDATGAGFDAVKVLVGRKGAQKLFAAGGAKGSADTGRWLNAGAEFVLKDGNETQQLAKFVIGSKSCD